MSNVECASWRKSKRHSKGVEEVEEKELEEEARHDILESQVEAGLNIPANNSNKSGNKEEEINL